MAALKQLLYELNEMWQACEEQDEYIKQVLMTSDLEDWDGVETTYTLEENVHTQKNWCP